MSWRDQLRPGSFRGAGFVTEDDSREGGRRGEHHEYPERDLPWFEDLGRKGRRFSITAFVIGADYYAARDALIHPFYGAFVVACESFSVTQSTSEGGMARFDLTFVEAGEPLAADARVDTGAASSAKADAVALAAKVRFDAGFSVAGLPAFVEDAAAKLVRNFATASSAAALLLGGSGRTLRAFEAGLALLPSGAVQLVRSAITLSTAVRAIVVAVAALGDSPATRVRALRQLADAPLAWPPVIGDTPVRARQRENQALLATLIVAAASAEAVRQTAELEFASYDDAVRLRDSLAGQLDDAAVRAADGGDDEHAEALDALRRTMVRDVTERGGSLARLYRYTPRSTEPALVIAHRIYGATETLDREAELVARNRIAHPGFVPGDMPLELRSAA